MGSKTADKSEFKTFSSSKGVVIELRPVSQFKIDTLRASQEEVPVPIYVAETVAGEKQEFPLDEIIAKNKDRMDEWEAYQARKHAVEADHAKKFMELIIWEGVSVEVPGPDSSWQKTSEHFGIRIPENEIERKLFYVYNELLGTSQDIGDLISAILSVSQIDEEAVAKLRNSFRSGIQRETNRNLSKKQRALEDKEPDL